MIVCDTGPLVAAALSNDANHATCVRLFNDMHAAGRNLLVPATVTAEVGTPVVTPGLADVPWRLAATSA